MQLTIDTQRDTYEQAIAEVQAAYGFNPAPTGDWPEAPVLDPRPGPQDLSDDDLWQGWTERILFDTLAALTPGARRVLRRIADVGGSATYDDVQAYFAGHPTPRSRKTGSAGRSPLFARSAAASAPTTTLACSNSTTVYGFTASSPPSSRDCNGPSLWPTPAPTSCARTLERATGSDMQGGRSALADCRPRWIPAPRSGAVPQTTVRPLRCAGQSRSSFRICSERSTPGPSSCLRR